MEPSATRRRLMAGLALAGLAPLPAAAQTAGPALPPCQRRLSNNIAGEYFAAPVAQMVYAFAIGDPRAASGQLLAPVQGKPEPTFRVVVAYQEGLGTSIWRLSDVIVRFPPWRPQSPTKGDFQVEIRAGSKVFRLRVSGRESVDAAGQAWVVEARGPQTANGQGLSVSDGDAVAAMLGARVDLVLSSGGSEVARFSADTRGYEQAAAERVAEEFRSAAAANLCKPAGCFLTTAAVHVIGLEDDCWELRTLRRFRDRVLANSARGRALVMRYYEIAPALVESLNRRPDAARRWVELYCCHIAPAAIAARMGLRRTAVWLYGRMVRRLQRLSEA